MPDRILRAGILSSEPISSLGWPAEVFYRRLHSIVDDFGRYSADVRLLRAALYPLLLEKVSDSDVSSWLATCERAGLIRIYSTTGKRFLEVLKFDQRRRAEKSKWPDPDSSNTVSCGQLTASVSHPLSSAPYSYSNAYANANTAAGPKPGPVSPHVDKPKEKPYKANSSVQELVLVYKALTGVDLEDRGWDKLYFKRYSKPSSELLAFFGTVEDASAAMEGMAAHFDKSKLSWTLETLVKRAADWKSGRMR